MNANIVQTIVILKLNAQTTLVASVVNARMDTVEMVLIAKVTPFEFNFYYIVDAVRIVSFILNFEFRVVSLYF